MEQSKLARVKVKDGICGFTTIIMTKRMDKNKVEVKIASPCEMVKKMADEIGEVEWKKVFARDMRDSLVYKAAAKYIKHAGCSVPAAVIRAIEVELEMAPAKGINIDVKR